MTYINLGAWLTEQGGQARLDIARLLETRALIQSSSGGGKSWFLRRLLEQSAGKVQQLIVDPEGEFATLREKHDLVIAAPHDGDALAHPKTAKILAERLLETGVSAVLDIYDLKRHEREAFVRTFCETLVNAPKRLWHPLLLVLDEAHLFCSEDAKAESTAAVIDIATRGRKRGQCLIAATQRIAKFNKDAAAELMNKFTGRTGLDVDIKRAAFDLGMTPKDAQAALVGLEPGQFYAYGPAISVMVRLLKSGDVATTHPKVGDRQLRVPPAPTAAIKAVLPKLADLAKEAEQELRTIEDLKRELATTRRELSLAKKAAPTIVQKPADNRAHAATLKRLRDAIEALMKFVVTINAKDFAAKAGDIDPAAVQKAIEAAVGEAMKLVEAKAEARNRELQALQREGARIVERAQALLADKAIAIDVSVKHNEPFTVAPPRPAPRAWSVSGARGNGSGQHLPPGERATLERLIQYPDGLRREQLTVLTGYRRSSRDAYIQRLREKGYLETSDDRVTATGEGVAAMPDAQPLPTGPELQEFWRNRLPEGERKILDVLIEAHPHAVDRTDLDERTGYQRSSRDAYLQRLRAKQLIEEPSRGQVRASETLFS